MKLFKLLLVYFPHLYCKIALRREKYLFDKYTQKLNELTKIAQKLKPASCVWEDGYDRYYINDYVESNKQYIKGDVLEFSGGNILYAKKYGTDVNVKLMAWTEDKDHYKADYYADLESPETLPEQKFDCIIATQVIMHSKNPYFAVKNLKSMLKRDGVLILTAPGSLVPHREHYMFIFTERSLKDIMEETFGNYENFKQYGNFEYATYMLNWMKKIPIKNQNNMIILLP